MLDVVHLIHVGGGDGQRGAVVAEGQGGDAGGIAMELAKPLLVEGIPDVHKAVRAACEPGVQKEVIIQEKNKTEEMQHRKKRKLLVITLSGKTEA